MTLVTTRYKSDFVLLFLAKTMRNFGYGMIAIVFMDFLLYSQLSQLQAGIFMAIVVVGDLLRSWFSNWGIQFADHRDALVFSGVLQVAAAFVYLVTSNTTLLLIVSILGIISATGKELDTFKEAEDDCLSELVKRSAEQSGGRYQNKSKVQLYSDTVSCLSNGLGLLVGGCIVGLSNTSCFSEFDAINNVFRVYFLLTVCSLVAYLKLNRQNCVKSNLDSKNGFGQIGQVLLMVILLVEGYGRSFLAYPLISFYLQQRLNKSYLFIGVFLFICRLGSVAIKHLSQRINNSIKAILILLLMHLATNLFLIGIPLLKSLDLRLMFLMAYYFISPIEETVRKSLFKIIATEEGKSDSGIWNARLVGLAIGLGLSGLFTKMNSGIIGFEVPFFIAGGVNIAIDLVFGIYLCFSLKNSQYSSVSIRVDDSELESFK